MKYIQLSGLLLDIVGAILLYIGSEKLSAGVIGRITRTIGQKGSVMEFLEENLTYGDLMNSKKSSDKYTKWGLWLIIAGFVFQFVGSW